MVTEIELTQGKIAIIDDCDADLIDFKWRLMKNCKTFYAFRLDDGKTIYLHRVILQRAINRELLKQECTDHCDGDGLNNTRENLRVSTWQQNNRNRRKKTGTSSIYKGVHKSTSGKWRATITVDRKNIHLGIHETEELAYQAYCKAAIQYFGEFARFE